MIQSYTFICKKIENVSFFMLALIANMIYSVPLFFQYVDYCKHCSHVPAHWTFYCLFVPAMEPILKLFEFSVYTFVAAGVLHIVRRAFISRVSYNRKYKYHSNI